MARRSRGIKKDSWWLAKRSLLVANLAVVAFVAWGFTGEYFRHQRLQAEIERLKGEAERLEARNFEAAKLGQKFAADEALEREARLKLGLRKPGESVIIVKDVQAEPERQTEAEKAKEIEPETPAGNLRLWWRFFFGQKENSEPYLKHK